MMNKKSRGMGLAEALLKLKALVLDTKGIWAAGDGVLEPEVPRERSPVAKGQPGASSTSPSFIFSTLSTDQVKKLHRKGEGQAVFSKEKLPGNGGKLWQDVQEAMRSLHWSCMIASIYTAPIITLSRMSFWKP
ncbi:hypothetical protein PG993_010754 [Apiospora rasikravindrae]|uniref:Uncharacterized protein n=1 Tax=Apiospora rasikravindrae TaxID=990691 RepID=A0ABR1SCF9_9PEZI